MALYLHRCSECSASFEAIREDAATCSGRCRQRRHKARAEAVHAAEIARAVEVLRSLRAAAALTPGD